MGAEGVNIGMSNTKKITKGLYKASNNFVAEFTGSFISNLASMIKI